MKSTTSSLSLLACVFAFAFASSMACDDSIQRGWLIDRTRVLGARVGTTTSSIVPSQKTNVDWLIARTSPTTTTSSSYAYVVCASPTGTFPTPQCEGPILASGSGTSNGDATASDIVSMPIEAPPAEAIGDATDLLMLAAFCDGVGTASLDARAFSGTCSSGGAPLLASLTLYITSNTNPVIDPADITFEGAALNAIASSTSCTPDMPVVTTDAVEHDFVIRLRDEERELIPTTGQHEALVLSHFVTGGELDRQYSALDPDEPAPKDIFVAWIPPGADEVPIDGNGRVVELFIVLRDGRGGAAFARRAVCVRRP